ncbi:MAG TPA: bifunctional diguanylate cyclase/phosphodiesterase, partial [Vicinamibacteria bacterium]|nr:bifunctional diguanylate cyclase/phosphodiesterase [Vicinamibacteria bacterium]
GDVVARVGGDEFAVLLEGIHGPGDAVHVSRRIHGALAAPVRLDGVELFPTVSIGIALSVTGYEHVQDVLRDAETAMRRARKAGIGRTEVFDRAMQERTMARMRLVTELRRAIERDELRVHYQPIVSLADGVITGFEALVRWQHPEQGLVPPAHFIPAAEETGLIVPLCAWVLRRACRQVRDWQQRFPADPPLSVSINFTSSHFTQPDVVNAVVGSLEEAGLEGRQLVMEVTESVLLSDLEAVVSVFAALKSLDIELHLDDFGTGYSSLSYLHRLPTDAVKIDRSFVGEMARDHGSEVMVKTIVELAHNLGRRVVAEGVETHDQLSALRVLECEQGQGYLFSRPLEAEAASALLATPPRW